MKKVLQAVDCAPRGRGASFGSIWCGALYLREPFLSFELRILQGSHTEPLAVSMVCAAMEPALGAPATWRFFHAWLCPPWHEGSMKKKLQAVDCAPSGRGASLGSNEAEREPLPVKLKAASTESKAFPATEP